MQRTCPCPAAVLSATLPPNRLVSLLLDSLPALGIARVALEHHLLRPSNGKLAAVFSSDCSARSIGGLASLIFRFALGPLLVTASPYSCVSVHCVCFVTH
jgi:hypothetical protein